MNATEFIAHRRTCREGKPEGDIRSPVVLGEVLTMVLEDRLSQLSRGASDPTVDSVACSLGTLIGYVQDLR